MALFGIKMTKRRMSPLGSFHTEVEDVNSFFKRGTARKPLGLVRAFFSGLSLILGGMMCYVALHYIPAFLQTQKIFNFYAKHLSAQWASNSGAIYSARRRIT